MRGRLRLVISPGQVDRDVAGLRDFLFAGIAANHVRAHPVIIGYAIDNQFRRDAFGIAMNVDIAQRERNDFFVDVTVVQLRIGVYAGQRTFQLADVALDAPAISSSISSLTSMSSLSAFLRRMATLVSKSGF